MLQPVRVFIECSYSFVAALCTHLDRIVDCRSLSGCCNGYQVGRMSRVAHCPGTDPLRGGIEGDTAAVLPGLKLAHLFLSFAPIWTMLMCGSHHLISQAGWNRCNPISLSIYLSPNLPTNFTIIDVIRLLLLNIRPVPGRIGPTTNAYLVMVDPISSSTKTCHSRVDDCKCKSPSPRPCTRLHEFVFHCTCRSPACCCHRTSQL